MWGAFQQHMSDKWMGEKGNKMAKDKEFFSQNW